MLRTIGTRHYHFLPTDYSLPVSSCPPRGQFFLSCNRIQKRINIHDHYTPPNNGKCDYKYAFFFRVFFFSQAGMFFRLYKIYDVMQNSLARKPTYHLI